MKKFCTYVLCFFVDGLLLRVYEVIPRKIEVMLGLCHAVKKAWSKQRTSRLPDGDPTLSQV